MTDSSETDRVRKREKVEVFFFLLSRRGAAAPIKSTRKAEKRLKTEIFFFLPYVDMNI